jgi:hypothetical protein
LVLGELLLFLHQVDLEEHLYLTLQVLPHLLDVLLLLVGAEEEKIQLME